LVDEINSLMNSFYSPRRQQINKAVKSKRKICNKLTARGQSNLAKATSSASSVPNTLQWAKFTPPPTHFPIAIGDRDLHLIQYALAPKSLHPEQNLDPFSRFCTAQSRDRLAHHARNPRLQYTSRIVHVVQCALCVRRGLIKVFHCETVRFRTIIDQNSSIGPYSTPYCQCHCHSSQTRHRFDPVTRLIRSEPCHVRLYR